MFGRGTNRDPPPATAIGQVRDAEKSQEDPAGIENDNDNTAELTTAQTTTSTNTNHEYPTGIRLGLVLSSVYISLFLVSLDRLIVTTAIPAITNEFDSLPDVGWYGAAYLLTSCAFQLLFGKLYSFYPIRAVYAIAVLLFEVGSALCGAAPNSIALIIGRAIQGVGSAGIFAGGIVVIVYAVPLHKRPFYQGMGGAVFGVSSILGPLVGGAFTSNVTWRWCFYINLPFGGVALAIIIFLLRIPDRAETKLSTKAKLTQLDAAGTTALIPSVVSILLALEWGGLEYPWNDRRVIALLTLGIFLGIVFILVQAFMPKTATIPPRIFKQRSILAGFWSTIVLGSQMIIFVYFLPIWFQAIQGVSAVDSGIRLLPTTLAVVVASISNGIFITKIGYYTPTMLAGTAICSIGAGLLTTLQIDTGMAKWVGYQVLYGFGLGLCFQAPNLAAQTVLPKNDVSIGASLMFFSQILGGAIFVSVGQNVLNNQLVQRLAGIPGFSPRLIQSGGATSLIDSFPNEYRHDVLVAYNESLRTVFRVGLVLATVSVLGAASMEWRSVKKDQPGSKASADPEAGAPDHPDTSESKSDIETLAGRSTHRVDEKPGSHSNDVIDHSEGPRKLSVEK
ncbi:putative MFS aflatoxin efflux [Rosellinia necatrix]|uniref:Putative MFS aflatoxin efflux n=1 Tax=Rosellinia necatrix TaxID=77044 RepID=A0A1W2TL91_ROSNE|nr:putative MFS aflatoxin efflux [Rosellinia necatrix]